VNIQDQELERVSSKPTKTSEIVLNIRGEVVQFLRRVLTIAANEGKPPRFRMAELEEHIAKANLGKWNTPGSAGRILRDLRFLGLVDYEVIHRAKSEYQINMVLDHTVASIREGLSK
jgi:hypothetical protein